MKININYQTDGSLPVLVAHGSSKWGPHYRRLIDVLVPKGDEMHPCKITDRNWKIILTAKDYAGRVF